MTLPRSEIIPATPGRQGLPRDPETLLKKADDYRATLHNSRLAHIEDASVSAFRTPPSGYETHHQIVLPYFGLFIYNVGNRRWVMDPNRALFISPGWEFYDEHPVAGLGHAAVIINPSYALLHEICRGTLHAKNAAFGCGSQPTSMRLRLLTHHIIGDFTATPVPASDGYGDPQVSWVVSVGGRRIFHGGDTLWHGSWWRIARQHAPFDAAFLPINGASFSWQKPASDAPAVLTPEQAMDAATILRASIIVPIHFGVRGEEGYHEVDDPVGRLRRAEKSGGPKVRVLQPGEWLDPMTL